MNNGERKTTSGSSESSSSLGAIPRISFPELAPGNIRAFTTFDDFCKDNINFGPACTVRYFPLSHVNSGEIDVNGVLFAQQGINCVVEVACGGRLNSLGNIKTYDRQVPHKLVSHSHEHEFVGYKLHQSDSVHDLHRPVGDPLHVAVPFQTTTPNIPRDGGAKGVGKELKETGGGSRTKERVRQLTGYMEFQGDEHNAALLRETQRQYDAKEVTKSRVRAARSRFRTDGQQAIEDMGWRYGVTGVQADHGPAHQTVENYGASVGTDNPIIQTAGTIFDNASAAGKEAKTWSTDVPWNSTGYISTKVEGGKKIAICVEAEINERGQRTINIQSLTPDNQNPVIITDKFFTQDMSNLKIVSAKIKEEENGDNRTWYKQYLAMFKHLGDMGLVLTAVSFAIQGFPLLTYTHDKWLATFGMNCVVVRRDRSLKFFEEPSFLPLRVLWVPPVDDKNINKMIFVTEVQDMKKMKLRILQMKVNKIDTMKSKMDVMQQCLVSANDESKNRNSWATRAGRTCEKPFLGCLYELNYNKGREGGIWALFPSHYFGNHGNISKIKQCCTFEIATTTKHIMLMGDFLNVERDLVELGLSSEERDDEIRQREDFLYDGNNRVQELYKILETVNELRRVRANIHLFQTTNTQLSLQINAYLDEWVDEDPRWFESIATGAFYELARQQPSLKTLREKTLRERATESTVEDEDEDEDVEDMSPVNAEEARARVEELHRLRVDGEKEDEIMRGSEGKLEEDESVITKYPNHPVAEFWSASENVVIFIPSGSGTTRAEVNGLRVGEQDQEGRWLIQYDGGMAWLFEGNGDHQFQLVSNFQGGANLKKGGGRAHYIGSDAEYPKYGLPTKFQRNTRRRKKKTKNKKKTRRKKKRKKKKTIKKRRSRKSRKSRKSRRK